MPKPDGERVAALEQKMTDFSERLNEVGQDVKEVKNMVQTKLGDHILMFDRINQIDKEIAESKMQFSKELNSIKSQSFMWRWLSPTLAAVFGGIVMYLATEYFKTH